ncbi:MAG TPA: hypothetical protein PK322_09020 [Opitutaceae bacterium]|nr:hypothetical protein [Opitutaceae bacterium]
MGAAKPPVATSTMKNRLLGILVGLLLAAPSAPAATPPFSTAPLTVVLAPDATRQYRPDAEATRDGQLVYKLQGQMFSGDLGKISPAKGATPRTSPWQTLSELLKGYASGDVAEIRSLYTEGSAAFFERLAAKPEMRERWLAAVGKITGAKVLLAYRDGKRVIAFVELEGGAAACPFAFEQVGSRYLLSAGEVGSGEAFWNLSLALANFRMKPEDIVSR